ncbi:MAG TPA: beta-ketoacyl-[acyl-carrier-protein] synthase family protein [Pseudonocardiaceae bacterium]
MTATVTGIGLLTPVGRGIDEVFDALCTGRSGLRAPPAEHPVGRSVQVGGFLPEIDTTAILAGPEATTLDRVVVLALLTAQDALDDAGIVVGRDVESDRVAVVIGGVGGMATMERQVLRRAERGRAGVSPYLLPGILPNMPAARVAIKFGIRGYSSSIGTACASGAQSIADGLRLIRDDLADVVLCGASEAPLFPTFADTFTNARVLARGWADPTEACRPFDMRRNGFVLAEGAGLLVLERTGHADARGVAGYADVVGWGATTDAYHPTTPRPDGSGAAGCMRRTLADAGVQPAEVTYVNAHSTGTKVGDAAEAAAIRAVFGQVTPPVSATKALTGHMLGTSGVVEAAACALVAGRGVAPPTFNLDDPDPACAVEHIRKAPLAVRAGWSLSNSFGFGGQNVSLLFGPPTTAAHRGG